MGDAVVSVPENTTTTKSGPIGGGVFRPNAKISGSWYKTVLVGWFVVLFLGWVIAPSIIPSPLSVFESFKHLVTEEGLLGELWTSLSLNLEAVGLATFFGLSLSYLAAIPVFHPLVAGVSRLRAMSIAGFSFLVVIFIGGGHNMKLTLMTFGIMVFLVTSMLDVVMQVPNDKLDYIRTLRAGEWRVLLEARIFGTLGQAFDITKQNAGMGWLMLPMVEALARGDGGIGAMLLNQDKHFSLSGIAAIQFVFLFGGTVQDLFIGWMKTIFAPWSLLAYTKK